LTSVIKLYILAYSITVVRGSKGFDRGLAAGEAIRSQTLDCKLKLNAEEKTQLAFAA